MGPVNARVARRVNDEVARRLEGKSLIVGCALDEVSNKWPFTKPLTGDLSERFTNQHVSTIPMVKATSVLETSPRRP